MLKLFKDKVTQDFMKTSFGNILEWYDFTIYGLFALQISQNFFPSNSQFVSLLLVFLTFAIGFVARPIGSFIFGYIGDVKGKHYAVNLSIWCMAIPTVMIGIIPSYQSIGVIAPIILVLLRIIQGLSAGGQFSGLIAIAVDSENKRKAFLVSLINSISVIGCFTASFIGFLSIELFSLLHSSNAIVLSLNWRVPFLLSGITFLIYLKLKPNFEKHDYDPEHTFSFKEIFKNQPREALLATVLGTCLGTIYYVLFTYLVTYMQTQLHFTKPTSFLIMNMMLLSSIFLYPIFGYLADYSPCRITTAKKQAILFLIAIGFFFLTPISNLFTIIAWSLMLISFCAISSYTMSFFGQLFAPKYRMSACSITYNIGFCISGFAPLASEVFAKKSHFGLQYFLLFTIALLIIILTKLQTTKRYQLIKNKNQVFIRAAERYKFIENTI